VNKLTPQKVTTALFFIWLFLLLPWLLLAPLSLMAFDAGPTFKAYVFVWSIWTFPVSVGIVAIVRKKAPVIALLPCLNVMACFVSGL
jgi:hypothetical protein